MPRRLVLAALVLTAPLAARPALASFHLMQIEQVIGGVGGDTSRQAIQLRMRQPAQNLVSVNRLYARDAAGQNPVLLIDFGTNVTNSASGARILAATAGFLPGLTPDFVMTNPIPAAYLAAGKLTFESDSGDVWWSLAWGAYSGTNLGVPLANGGNDADGDFNPAFPGPLPSTTQQALRFGGTSAAVSTNNAADYALTAGAATFTSNANATGTVPVELLGFDVR